MKLYSKDAVEKTMTAMSETGRFSHTYILTGDEGFGKKKVATYIAMMLMCENRCACGECRECRRVANNQHPDLTILKKENKSKSFSVDSVREKVVAECITMPNDANCRVYILPDCDGWKDATQDALLKVTEEPPEHAYFIFTAKSKGVFLNTLISRATCIEIPEAKRDSAKAYLIDNGYDEEKAKTATSLFGGNIGKCKAYLEGDDELEKMVSCAKSLANAMAERQEYAFLSAITAYSPDRAKLCSLADMVIRIVRDAIVIQTNSDVAMIGSSIDMAKSLASKRSNVDLLRIYEDLFKINGMCEINVNVQVAICMLATHCT